MISLLLLEKLNYSYFIAGYHFDPKRVYTRLGETKLTHRLIYGEQYA